MASEMKGAQIAIGEMIPKCKEHIGLNLTLVCDECDGQLVCSKCIVIKHKGHSLSDPEEVAENKKLQLIRKLQTVQTRLVRVKNNITELSQASTANENATELSISKIREKKKKLKDKIDEIGDRLEEQCLKQKAENQTAISEKSTKFNSLVQNLDEVHPLLKHLLENGNMWDILRFNSDLGDIENPETNDDIPSLPKVVYADSNDKHDNDLEHFFGVLSWKSKQPEYSGNTVPVPVTRRPLPETPHSSTPVEITQPRFRFEEIFQVQSKETRIRAVCPATNNKVWVTHLSESNYYTKQISLIPKDSSRIMTAVLDSQLTDVASIRNGSGCAIVSCWDKSIRKIDTEGNCVFLFNTDAKPTGVCVDKDNNFIVTFREDRKIVKYIYIQEKVKVMKTYPKSTKIKLSSGTTLIKSPDVVCASEFTGDIAVIDADDKNPKVVVLTNDLKVRHFYGGGIMHSEARDFGPNGICFDKQDNLFIADGIALDVLVLDSYGQVIFRLNCDSAKPCGVGIDNTGLLWIGFSNGKIKIYRQQSENVYSLAE